MSSIITAQLVVYHTCYNFCALAQQSPPSMQPQFFMRHTAACASHATRSHQCSCVLSVVTSAAAVPDRRRAADHYHPRCLIAVPRPSGRAARGAAVTRCACCALVARCTPRSPPVTRRRGPGTRRVRRRREPPRPRPCCSTRWWHAAAVATRPRLGCAPLERWRSCPWRLRTPTA